MDSETSPAASPDGRWLAYQSDESGRNEIYLQGGTSPEWARSGRELFFESATGDSLFAARIDSQNDGAVQDVQALLPLRQSGLGFDVFPGDSLFLVFDPPQAVGDRAQPAVVVHNFDAELETRMGTALKR